jgi:hypothetical protein
MPQHPDPFRSTIGGIEKYKFPKWQLVDRNILSSVKNIEINARTT